MKNKYPKNPSDIIKDLDIYDWVVILVTSTIIGVSIWIILILLGG